MIVAEPQNDRGDDQEGPVVGGSFGVAGGQGAVLLEPGEAAFDDVAAGADLQVPAAGRPPPEPLARRRAIWSTRSGLVKAMPRARSAVRVEGWE